jgi:hypothetical protein
MRMSRVEVTTPVAPLLPESRPFRVVLGFFASEVTLRLTRAAPAFLAEEPAPRLTRSAPGFLARDSTRREALPFFFSYVPRSFFADVPGTFFAGVLRPFFTDVPRPVPGAITRSSALALALPVMTLALVAGLSAPSMQSASVLGGADCCRRALPRALV